MSDILNKRKHVAAFLLVVVLSVSAFSGCGTAIEQSANRPISNQTLDTVTDVDLEALPEFYSDPYVEINDNIPFFTASEMTTDSFEDYSELDELGRCGVATASVGTDLMPTEERGAIGQVKPSGWHTIKYDNIDGRYLYNRCHLIGYQLSGENANEKNLMTGTRYLNVEGMLPFENEVADYVRTTQNHVMYRVTPIYDGTDLVAKGVEIEAKSVEDHGKGVQFHVFCYNVQPGIAINYADGSSTLSTEAGDTKLSEDSETEAARQETYVLNRNTKKFHHAWCESVSEMKERNKKYVKGTSEEMIRNGYEPCQNCKP